MSGTVRLPARMVDWLLRGALAAASKDDITPVLCAVKWTIADGRVTVIATDRYRVHQLFVPAPDGTPDGVFLMDRRQASLATRWRHGSARTRGSEVVDITWTDPVNPGRVLTAAERVQRRFTGSVRVELRSDGGPDADVLAHDAAQVHGNYPPIEGLFEIPGEEARAHDVLLTPELLASTKHLRVEAGEPLRFTMPPASERPTSERAVNGGAKLRPVIVMNTSGTARALIQPHRAPDMKEWGA